MPREPATEYEPDLAKSCRGQQWSHEALAGACAQGGTVHEIAVDHFDLRPSRLTSPICQRALQALTLEIMPDLVRR